ncbi:MAG: SEC-C metal-binding domain-containing protein [bacterium]
MASQREPDRNSPCPCGSGRKYKRCCAGKTPAAASAARKKSRTLTVLLSVMLVALATTWVVMAFSGNGTPNASSELDRPAGQSPAAWEYDAANNRHWHPEHGDWHDGPPPGGSRLQNKQTPQSDDDAPEPWEYDAANNRHWDPSHGHWHQGPPPQGQ